MKHRKARAEIKVDKNSGWKLPIFGSKNPRRYWAHAHFEGDPSWEKEIWTLIVDLDCPPPSMDDTVTATIYFMAEDAPHDLIQEAAKFTLSCEDNVYTSGVVTCILD
jgi:hypothetical protein